MCAQDDDPTQHDKRKCANPECQREAIPPSDGGVVYAYCQECLNRVLAGVFGNGTKLGVDRVGDTC